MLRGRAKRGVSKHGHQGKVRILTLRGAPCGRSSGWGGAL